MRYGRNEKGICGQGLCHFPSTRWLQFCVYALVLALFWACGIGGAELCKSEMSKAFVGWDCVIFRLRVGYNFALVHWFLLGFATLL